MNIGIIRRIWRDEEKLWKIFWIYGVLPATASFLVWFAVSVFIDHWIYQQADRQPFDALILAFFVGPVLMIAIPCFNVAAVLYGFWWIVATWRCAFNVDWRGWGYIVRALIVLGIVGALFSFSMGLRAGQEITHAAACRQQVRDKMNRGEMVDDMEAFLKQCEGRTAR